MKPAPQPTKSFWPGNPFSRTPAPTQPKAQVVQTQETPGRTFAPAHMSTEEQPKYAPAFVNSGGQEQPPDNPVRPPEQRVAQTAFPQPSNTQVVIPPPPGPPAPAQAVIPPPPSLPATTQAVVPPPSPTVTAQAVIPPPPGPLPAIDPPPLPGSEDTMVKQEPSVPPQPVKSPVTNPTVQAKQLIVDGRKALKAGDLDAARQMGMQAKQLNPRMNFWDDTPQKLLDDVNRATVAAAKASPAKEQRPGTQPPAPEPVKVALNPRQQLKLARDAYGKGQLDDAEALLNGLNGKGVSWGLFEDNPAQLRTDIQRARVRRNQEESVRVLAEARRDFKAGNFEEARAKAHRAEQLHGPYSVWDLSDRPQNLLGEIARAERRTRRPLPPPVAAPAPTEVAKAPADKGNTKTDQAVAQGPPPVPVPVQMPTPQAEAHARQQAFALLQEAGVLQRQGKLLQARQKALQAKNCGARFGPDEDGPDVLLLQLSAACDVRIAQLMRQADACISKSAEPSRYDRAQAELKAARELARAFGQDTVRIDQKSELLALEATLVSRPGAVPDKNIVAQVIHKQEEQSVPPPPVIETPSKMQPVTNPQAWPEPKKASGQTIIIPQDTQAKAGSGQTIMIPQGPVEPKVGAGQVVTVPQPPEQARPQVANVTPPEQVRPQVTNVTPPEQARPQVANVTPPQQARPQVANVTPPQQSMPPQVVQVTPPQVNVPQVPPRQHGMNLLEQARRELKAGQTKMARTLAVEAFNPAYGVQEDAAAVLRSIDAEEFNQRMLAANRAFDAGSAEFYRKNFRQARAIMAGLDPRLLSYDRQGRLKEIMQTSEMAPPPEQAIAQVGFGSPGQQTGEPAGKVIVSDGGEDFASNYRAMEKVIFDKLREEGLSKQKDALERFRNGDAELALEILTGYLNNLNDAKLSADRVVLLRRPVEDRLQKLRTIVEQKKLQDVQIGQLANNAHGREKMRQKLEQERNEKVAELIKQANEFYREGKYQEAIMLAQKAKDVDPSNIAADAVEKIATMHQNLDEAKRISRSKEKIFLGGLNDAEKEGPFLDMTRPVDFGDQKYWNRVNNRRNKEYARGELITKITPKQLEMERKLLTPIGPNFKDISLKNAISDLQSLSGVNLFFDQQAVMEEGINLDQLVTLQATDQISLKSTLEILLRPARMTYVVKGEYVSITTEQHTRGKLVTKTYSVADLVIPVENFVQPDVMNLPKVLDTISKGQGIQNAMPTPWNSPLALNGGQPIGSQAGVFGSQASTMSTGPGAGGTWPGNSPVPGSPKGPGRTIEDLLIKVIQSTVQPTSWSEMGGQGTVQYFPLGMALVVTQTPNIQEEIAELLQALRRLQDLEVAIEMRVIGLSEEFFEYMGMDFNVNIRNRNTQFQPQLTTQQFTPPGQINNFQPTGFVSGLTPAGTLTRDLGIPLTNSSFNFAIPPFGGFPGTLGADGGLSLGLAFLSDIQVFMFMEAAQGDQRTNLMQAPKLTLFNGQTAMINVADFQFLLTSIQPINVGSLLFFAPINTPIPLGIGMTVNAVVSADRRFVRLTLVPTITSIAPNIGLFPIQTPIQSVFDVGANGGTVSGQVQNVFQTFLQQPNLTAITVMTTVSVPDGGTVVLGGVKTLVEARNEFGPPILSQIPYLSRLFRNTSYGRETRTLMIMVTPRIIINEEEEEQQVGSPEFAVPRQ
jgi:type II secretory pathway component GspD/PulD (secretin)/tetratricopeptide (TPR) repeat protein